MESEKAQDETLNTKHIFGGPEQMSMVNDSTLLILDRSDNGYVAHLFSTNGRYLRGFGTIGQGPGEYITPNNVSVSEDGKKIYIYDFRHVKAGVYSVDSLLTGNDSHEQLSYRNDTIDNIRFYEAAFQWNDSDYLCLGMTENCRLASFHNGERTSIYHLYPPLLEEAEHNRSLWNNGSLHAVSPDGKHIVYGTWIGMAFEVLENNNGKIESKVVKGYHKPDYEVAAGAIPVCITSSEDCYEGFRTLYADKDRFYGVVSGAAPDYDQRNTILCFDYEGKLLRKIETESIIDCITVKDKTAYAVAHLTDEEYRLIKVNL